MPKIIFKGEIFMLQKLKNKVRSLVQKWRKVELSTRFSIIVFIVYFTMITFIMPPGLSSCLKEENYTAMEQIVSTIVEEKNTDIEFDTSKIYKYEVTHRDNGYKEIFIAGTSFEELYLTVDKDYQIKKLTKGGELALILTAILYYLIVYCLGCIITAILFLINRIIKKIVQFFKT